MANRATEQTTTVGQRDSIIALTLAGYSASEAERLAACFASPTMGDDIAVLMERGAALRAECRTLREAAQVMVRQLTEESGAADLDWYHAIRD